MSQRPPSPASVPAGEVRLIGPPAVHAGGSERLLGPHRVDQLLAYLACRGRWSPRAELAELFWPGRPEGSARANLRVLPKRARRLQPALELQAERVRWAVPSGLARLDAATANGDEAGVVALAAAPLLEGLEPGMPEGLLEWLRHERERLQSLVQAAVARRDGAAALQRLLRVTEGLPLALELAAAATRLVPLEQLADERQRSIAVLDTGRPVSGLRACFEQSWALLDPALQRGLAALAWLPGPADRALTMAVAGLSLDDLAVLVDHSLLRLDAQGRCGLHPLLRQWLLERVDAGQRDALAARHAAQVGHRLAAIDGAEPQAAAAALRALDADLPHIVQAWGWQVEHGTPALQARFARVMGQYFVARGGAQAILPFLERAAGTIAAGSKAGLAARALTRRTQAMLEYHGGNLAAAETHAREALRRARQAGDRSTALACLTVLGNALVFAGRSEEARAPLDQAARRALAAGDARLAGAALNALGLIDRAAGRYEAALARFRELAAIAERSLDFGGQMTALINAGNIEGLLQRWDAARHTTLRALACAEAGGMEGERALLHTILAEISLETGDRAGARDHIALAEAALPRSTAAVLPTQLRLVQMNLALL